MKTKILTTLFALLIGCTATIAQDKTKSVEKQSSSSKTEMAQDSVYYTCPMHPEVKSDKPGKCPKCGMTLEKKTTNTTGTQNVKKEAMITYTCSMHPEVISDKPGKCPKCGMALIVKK
jgi:ribosomal protein S27AE